MEEQKKSTLKVEETKKLTYEQLNDACNQLAQQNMQLKGRNRELEQFVMFKRLDYLFKVLELSDKFSEQFVTASAKEIEDAMTLSKEENKGEEK